MNKRTIKFLWGRAAGRCSMPECRKQLCPYPIPGVTLGEMCHIIARNPDGPRGTAQAESSDIDDYQNLILLCSEHHKIIDSLPEQWTVARLKQVKLQHEQWVEEQLHLGALQDDLRTAYKRVARYLERSQTLSALLWADIGNARFLNSLQESDDGVWFNLNARTPFREGFLDLIDSQFGNSSSPPFSFDWLNALVVFPDSYDKCRSEYIGLPSIKPEVPMLLQGFRVTKQENTQKLKVRTIQEVPFLPLTSGYIWGRDATTHLPNDIRDEPCEDFWGAYYWIRPQGIRTVILGIGVLDPLECTHGTAIWYAPNEARPFMGVRPAREATPEFMQQMDQAVIARYKEILDEFSSQQKR